MTIKTIEERIAECFEIRKKLQQCGVLTISDVAKSLGEHMNDYVKTATPQTFKLKSHERGIEFRVILAPTPGKQSGIEMIQ
jgi:hypothetical protein